MTSAAYPGYEDLAMDYVYSHILPLQPLQGGERAVLTDCCQRMLYALYPDQTWVTSVAGEECRECAGERPPPEEFLDLLAEYYGPLAQVELCLLEGAP